MKITLDTTIEISAGRAELLGLKMEYIDAKEVLELIRADCYNTQRKDSVLIAEMLAIILDIDNRVKALEEKSEAI